MTKNIRELRAANAGKLPGGSGRLTTFPSEIRANVINQDGREFYELTGYATVFNRGYDMWDQFGKYTEIADSHMLDRSLAAGPDVAFLLNHRGMTMARTTNRTLQLTKDSTGLHARALLNAERTDVQDLASAVSDGLIDEMSFGFLLEDGEWNEDFTEYRITRADINRGDVSAVNYGANPHTSIGMRSQEIMRALRDMPASMAREAITLLSQRADIRSVPEDKPEPKPVSVTDTYAARWEAK